MEIKQLTTFFMTPIAQAFPLEGGCNFRDLGGYRTSDGRAIRRGQLFRSGVLAYLTHRDHQLLSQLGIRTICDLRWPDEYSGEPTRWLNAADAQVLSWNDSQGETVALQLSGKTSNAEIREAVIDFYQGMHEWLRPRLRGLFACLVEGVVPIIFHCSSGKDRTGLAAALVLSALGVSRETILADYSLTNKVDLEQFFKIKRRSRVRSGNRNHPLLTMSEEARKVLLSAETEYLSAGLAAIEQKYGSIDEYLRRELGVTDVNRWGIQNALLTE